MRKGVNILLLCIACCVAVMLSACVNTLELAVPRGAERAGVTHEGAVANARAYFDTHFGSNTRSNDQTPTPEAPYVVGNLVPDWESGVTIANEEKSYTDFAMQKDYRYFLALKDQNEELCVLELYSRLASVDDFGLDTLNQYVATYIPDISFLSCYESYKKDNLLTCEYIDWFTGVVLYTDLNGYHIAAYKYYDGGLVDSSFLYDGQKSQEENVADFMRVMGGITLMVAPASEDTRSFMTFDVPGGTYFCFYDDSTGEVIWEYCNIDAITVVGTAHTRYDLFDFSGGGSSVGMGDGETLARPDIPTGGGGSTTTTEEEDGKEEDFEEELVKDLFDTSNLTDEQVEEVGKMLMEIIQDCMGGELYSKLEEECEDNGQLSIIFASSGAVPSYKNSTRTITITDNYSDTLLHEMFHAYQDVMIDSDLSTISTNLEIEAQVAKYKYAYREGSPISDERKKTMYRNTSSREALYSVYCATKENATFSERMQVPFDFTYKDAVEKIMDLSEKEELGYQFDAERSMDDNWSNIIELSIKCE